MKTILLASWVLGIALSGAAAAAEKDSLDQTARIAGIVMTTTEPCATERKHGVRHQDWPVGKGDRFGIENRTGKKHYIDVKWDPFNQIQDPDIYVVNKGEPALGTDYCSAGGDISKHAYAFGIHDLHAFIYLPMRLNEPTGRLLADHFYLFVRAIPIDSSLCKGLNAVRERCLALRRLVIEQATGTEEEFISAVEDEILNILPPSPYKDDKFHNGVIHGGL